jgi:hypothetical protein
MSIINTDQAFYSKMSEYSLRRLRVVAENQLAGNFDQFFLTHGGEVQKAKHRELFEQMIVCIDTALVLKEKP